MAATTVMTPEEKAREMATEDKQDDEPLLSGEESGDEEDGDVPQSGGSGLEGQFLGRFMNPMMANLEQSAKRNTDMLDEIQRQMDEDRQEKFRKNSSQHIPDGIKEYGVELKDIMETLENLIVYENYDENEIDELKQVKSRLKKMDPVSEVAVLSHSISAYVSTLEPSHLKHLANRVVSDVTKWLCALFRMENSSAYFHEEEKDGLVKICRLAIHRKYPKYASDGYEALYSRPPVIYISAASRPGLGQYLCAQLGLPSSCVVTVPLYKNTHKMDLDSLNRLVGEDIAASKTPVMVVAYAGTPVVGHVDDINMLQEFCQKHEMWLHIEGNNVALLTYFTMPTNVKSVAASDSIALNLGGWLGVPAIPYVTLYKTPEEVSQARLVGLTFYNARYKLNCMPLWIVLQNIGHYGVFEKIKYAVDLSKAVHDKISTLDTIRNVSKKRKIEPQAHPLGDGVKQEYNALGRMMVKVVSALTLFEIENPTIVFRYVRAEENPDVKERTEDAEKKKDKKEGGKSDLDEEEPEQPFERNPYFDALNIWLCETLKRDCPKVHIAALEIASEGVCIRFAPMESIHDYDTKEEEVQAFIHCLGKQLSILDATVSHRDTFQEIVEAQDNIRLVTLTNWAGLGAIQYIPQSQVTNLDNLTELGQTEINKINYELVQQLKSADTAFSLGQTSERLFCVRFGLVTEDTDLEELIGLVYSTGKEVEESTTFLESMAETIRKGIEEAKLDLVKEHNEKLAQEGALRQIPMLGSLINWWSPPPKEGAKGRAFNLASGKIISTEETYKYKMQVQEEAVVGNNISPPPSSRPRVGSYKASLQTVRGPRTQSQSSTTQDQEPASPDPSQTSVIQNHSNEQPEATQETATEVTEETQATETEDLK